MSGEAAVDEFGYAVAGAGDANGDGFADVVVGAYGNDAGGSAAGRSYVFYGGPGADPAPDFTQTGEATLDNLGFAVSGAGDIDGDGYGDLIVGAPYADSDGGRAYLTRSIAGKSRPVAQR